MLKLVVISGPDRGKEFRLTDEKLHLLGRLNELLSVLVSDDWVSRVHAELATHLGRWYITDAQSNNGTFVNGRRVTSRTALNHNDHVRIGRTVLRIDLGPGYHRNHTAQSPRGHTAPKRFNGRSTPSFFGSKMILVKSTLSDMAAPVCWGWLAQMALAIKGCKSTVAVRR